MTLTGDKSPVPVPFCPLQFPCKLASDQKLGLCDDRATATNLIHKTA